MDLAARLEELKESGLHRELREIEGPQGPTVELDGHEVLLLCSNNYLGLADHPAVRAAAAEAAIEWGAGAGASRLISGNMSPHLELERELAAFMEYDEALLFGSGYLANTGIVSALAGRGEVVFSDELNHASIIDGCRLSRAETRIYRHGDLEHLGWLMDQAGGRAALLVTDGVFSMDGDVAPVIGLLELARRRGARLMVDEAHAIGTTGPGGRGAVSKAGLSGEVDVVVGTLGKSLGSYGAFACCDGETREYLLNASRQFIFSTAPPPPAVAAAMAALALLIRAPEMVDRVRVNAGTLREALAGRELGPGPGEGPIVPVMIGEARAAMLACERALERGVFAQGIRPPTVPEGTSRLRLTVTAGHTEAQMTRAAEVLEAAVRSAQAAPAGP